MKKAFPKALVIVLLIMAAFVIGMGQISAVVTTTDSKNLNSSKALKNYQMTMKIKGQKTGNVSDNTRVLAVSHSIVSPRDIQSGLPTGQRMHKPFVITKEVDKISPLLMNILCTNENVTEVILTFSNGNPNETYTIKLTNANIASVDLREALNSNGLASEDIAFTYQKITWTYANGATAMDDWEARI